MCDSCPTTTEPDDDRLTWRDMDAGTAELLRHDQTKTRHIYPCGVSGCWACDHIYARIQEAS